MRAYLSLSAVVGLLCGCAHEHFTKGGGDVGQFIVQNAVAWGGHPVATNALPAVKCRWRYSEDPHGFVIYLPRGDYPAIKSFLGQAFGRPQFGPVDTTDGCELGEYRLTAKGGGIQFSYDATATHIVLIRPLGQSKGRTPP
ncbi:MAG TPA: hypothetical protein VN829_11195 [Dongiaceae bacterium]|nr:hypothetical protein [Dongiaceae bacterium]